LAIDNKKFIHLRHDRDRALIFEIDFERLEKLSPESIQQTLLRTPALVEPIGGGNLMFNQSGECRPGWYVVAFRLVVITSSLISSVNR
jgi:hypothetical protein